MDAAAPPLRTPLRPPLREDARAAYTAYSRMLVALGIATALVAMAVTPDGTAQASSWSDASTWTVTASVPTTTTTISYSCSFTGSLAVGGSVCATTTRTGPPPEGVTTAPGGALAWAQLPFSTYFSAWTFAGCDASFNDSGRCAAVRILLGYSIFTYIILSLFLATAVGALLHLGEALLQMQYAAEDKVAGLRVPNLWKWLVPLTVLPGFAFFTWPIAVVAALQLVMEETIKAADITDITSKSQLVRPGSSWWFVLFACCLLCYCAWVNWRLESAHPHPDTSCSISCCNGGRKGAPPQQAWAPAGGPPSASIPAWPPSQPQQAQHQPQFMQPQSYAQQFNAQQAQQAQQAQPPPPPPSPPPPPPQLPPEAQQPPVAFYAAPPPPPPPPAQFQHAESQPQHRV